MRRSGSLTFVIAVTLVLQLAPSLAGGPETGPLGLWTNPKNTVAIDISPCREGGGLCGHIVWLKKPHRGDGSLKRDRENPDPKLRDRTLCGLEILSGFVHNGDGRWENGRIYNPEEGQTYRANMELKSDEALRVRGYELLPVFGRTLVWQRLPEVPGDCPVE